jgi:hypothetical protein
LEVGSAAFGGTVRKYITSGLSAETTLLFSATFNALNGFHWLATPESRIVLSPTAGTAGRLAIKLDQAATLTMSGYVVLEEIGG